MKHETFPHSLKILEAKDTLSCSRISFTKSGKGHTWRGSTLYCWILPFLIPSMPASTILHLPYRKQTKKCTVSFCLLVCFKVGFTLNVELSTGLELMIPRSRVGVLSEPPGSPKNFNSKE